MKSPYHRQKIVFRFVGLSDELVKTLIDILPKVQLKVRKQRKTGNPIVSFDLGQLPNCTKLRTFIRKNRIPSDKYGIWVLAKSPP